ncbi:MAG TPA: hypothetical protein ACFYD7_05125 [Candidatus Wujingus californicus]|uniref:hypothetical protein n=1 Tax=Candidatus Wujingus californicus TaxID=3367618 RepID=UPI001DBF67DC|nr:hypothetical protein [Planctomycetota bacterium]MDO8131818.1 hypothetical protein [Candidatus Brocadiales bacterium]
MSRNRNSQVVGNAGLYFVCYHLSRLGWNAMPTSRNAKGIDIIAYNGDCTRTISLQVKTLSKRAPVPLGTSIDRLLGDFWIIVNNLENIPAVFVMKPKEVHDLAHRGEKDGKVSYWLQPKSYSRDEFRDKWDRIGKP